MSSPSYLSQRQFISALAGLMLCFIGSANTHVFAQTASAYPLEALLAEAALPDEWLGSKDAPVTVIEYASMTCPHCAAFHAKTFPALKAQYNDTGKVRFVLREFPSDPLSTAGFMLARCAGPNKREAMIDLLFAQQKNWVFTDKPFQGLSSLIKQTGMSQESFESCLKDQALYDKVNAVREAGAKKFAVEATPTFFINGKKANGDMSIEDMGKLLAPFLKE